MLGGNLVGLILGAAIYALFYFLSLFMGGILGFGPVAVGLAFLPMAAAVAAASTVAGRALARVGARRLFVVSTLLVTTARRGRGQVGGPVVPDGQGFFSDAVHQDHFHLGITPTKPPAGPSAGNADDPGRNGALCCTCGPAVEPAELHAAARGRRRPSVVVGAGPPVAIERWVDVTTTQASGVRAGLARSARSTGRSTRAHHGRTGPCKVHTADSDDRPGGRASARPAPRARARLREEKVPLPFGQLTRSRRLTAW